MSNIRRQPTRPAPSDDTGLVVVDDQPLIAIPNDEDGRRRVAYYTSDASADEALTDAAIRRAKALAGAWADLDWDDVAAALHAIRHQTPPTPPAEETLGALLGEDLTGTADDRGRVAP